MGQEGLTFGRGEGVLPDLAVAVGVGDPVPVEDLPALPGAVKLDGEIITDEMAQLALQGGEVLQVGKRRVGRVVLQ